MPLQYTQVTDITVTAGTKDVTVNSAEDLSKYVNGDFIYIAGQNPLVIDTIAAQAITLAFNAPFTSANSPALVAASNVPLRQVLADIQANNAIWSTHFQPLMDFVNTSSPSQINLIDALGDPVLSYSAVGLNALAQNIIDADANLQPIEDRIDQAEIDLTNIESTLDQKVSDATTQADLAKDWATKDTEVETGLESAKTYAQQAATEKAEAVVAKDAAELAKQQAETILDNFDDRYLGSFATDPVLDNDGDPLADGAIYLNTTENVLRFYTVGTGWLSPEETIVSYVASALQYRNEAEGFRNEAEVFRDQTESLAGGVAPDSLKLNGQLPSFYATAQSVTDLTNSVSNVDNTADLDKPISNAMQTALDEIETFALAGLVL